jgi:hypothetical protein
VGECPFCGGDVSEDTLIYGGTCPTCFGEIPGEEAATDPGEVVKAAQDRSDNRRRVVKTIIPFLLLVPVIGGLAVMAIGIAVWNRNPTVEPMIFDEVEEFDYDIVVAPEPEPDADPGTRVVKNTAPKGPTRPTQKVDEMGVPIVDARQVGGLSFDGVGVTASRSGETLSDDSAIRKMIQQNMRKYGRQLKLCYDKRLKMKTDLEGRWQMNFTLAENGYPEKVRFTGMEMRDAEFEQCMASTVRKWRFNKITRPQPVQKNWRFRR